MRTSVAALMGALILAGCSTSPHLTRQASERATKSSNKFAAWDGRGTTAGPTGLTARGPVASKVAPQKHPDNWALRQAMASVESSRSGASFTVGLAPQPLKFLSPEWKAYEAAIDDRLRRATAICSGCER